MSCRCVAIMASGDNKMDRRIEENMVEVERCSLCKHVFLSLCLSVSLSVSRGVVSINHVLVTSHAGYWQREASSSHRHGSLATATTSKYVATLRIKSVHAIEILGGCRNCHLPRYFF